jgi:hypothetical protein
METLMKINELLENPELKTAVLKLLDHIGLGDVSNDMIDIHNQVCHNTDIDEGINKEVRLKLWNVHTTAKLIEAVEKEFEKIERLNYQS